MSAEGDLDRPLEELDFSVRAFHCLMCAGVTTLRQLTRCRPSELLALHSFGRGSLSEVKRRLADLGLSLRAEAEDGSWAITNARRAFSGAPWEARVGYCRAIRVGRLIWVTGTAPVNPDGSVYAPGDAGAQTRRCFEIIGAALRELGADLIHVVRTRIYVTDISRWKEIGAEHRARFAAHPPCTTMVEVRRLIDPEMLVEIEVDAALPEP